MGYAQWATSSEYKVHELVNFEEGQKWSNNRYYIDREVSINNMNLLAFLSVIKSSNRLFFAPEA